MNKRLRSLIQKLGEAIHETVSESQDIASVVQDIRKQGFDVLLMLEATIGLNEVEEQPGTALIPSGRNARGKERQEPADRDDHITISGFTSQDIHFLRSLRISVSGDSPKSAD